MIEIRVFDRIYSIYFRPTAVASLDGLDHAMQINSVLWSKVSKAEFTAHQIALQHLDMVVPDIQAGALERM